eukprot:2044088-Amphidinium_carterae.1
MPDTKVTSSMPQHSFEVCMLHIGLHSSPLTLEHSIESMCSVALAFDMIPQSLGSMRDNGFEHR